MPWLVNPKIAIAIAGRLIAWGLVEEVFNLDQTQIRNAEVSGLGGIRYPAQKPETFNIHFA